MNYLSVCSGVEAATVAWHDLGFNPIAFSEIEKFPSEVLKHHYPSVPNMGDMTKYKEWNLNEPINLLVGGTPCQSFSVAGLRKGLEDPRGNLALTYVGILDKFRPKWCVWENVPGVLSSNGGRDFGSFLGALVELGYGFSYRVLDAQYFGVPQRRRRVFVVGCLGDWESPAKVLFESSCLRRDTPSSREKRKEVTPFTPSSFGNYGEGGGTIRANGGDLGGGSETLITFDPQSSGEYGTQPVASTVAARDYKSASDLIAKVYETHPADSRVKEMGDVSQTVTSRWGTGGGNVPLVQTIALQDVSGRDKKQNGKGWNDDGVSYTIDTHATQGVVEAYSLREDAKANNFSATPLHVTPALQALRPSVQSHHAQTFVTQPIPINTMTVQGRPSDNGRMGLGIGSEGDPQNTITKAHSHAVFHQMAVRRLTPIECERLQGFPDGYTDIPWRGKDESPDGQRYKAMGNSMAVPVMRWIGKRIKEIEA
jgi:DNA (cytosine-5)-methyltransferase 1